MHPGGIRGALHPRWTASLCVAPRTNSAAAIGPSSRLASGALRRSRCSRESAHGLPQPVELPRTNSAAAIGPSSRLEALRRSAVLARVCPRLPTALQPVDRCSLAAFEGRCIPAGPLRSALLLGPIALRLLALRPALPAERFAALGARASLPTDCRSPWTELPRQERRSIPAEPLRSALLLGPVALLPTLAARRCTLAAFEGRCGPAGPCRSRAQYVM